PAKRAARSAPAGMPASCRAAAKAAASSGRSSRIGVDQRRQAGLARGVGILGVFEHGAKGALHRLGVDGGYAEDVHGLSPVDGLGDAGRFDQVQVAQAVYGDGHALRQPGRGFGDAPADDGGDSGGVGVGDPVVEAAAFEGVVQVAGAVGGQDRDRGYFRAPGAEFGNGDGGVGEQFQQKGLEFVVGPVYFVDQ